MRRWVLYDTSDDYSAAWKVEPERAPHALEHLERVEVVSVDAVRALLPRVYDGVHLVDCPYVAVLQRINDALGSDTGSEGT